MKIHRHTGGGRYPGFYTWIPDQVRNDMRHFHPSLCPARAWVLAGKNKFNDTLMGFALHYGFKPQVAPAFAAWVKGKIERPYHFIREGFWRGYGFICRETANREVLQWLQLKDERIHGTTHEAISHRFERERPQLQVLPPQVCEPA